MKIKTLYKNLYILKNFCSVDENRQILHGVYIEPCSEGGLFAVATTGRIIGIFYDPDGETDGKYIIDVKRMTRIFDLRAAPSCCCEQEAEEIQKDQRYYHDDYTVVIDDKSLDVFECVRQVASSNDLCLMDNADEFPNYRNTLVTKMKPITALGHSVKVNINPTFFAPFAFAGGISLYVAADCHATSDYLTTAVYVLDNDNKNFLGAIMPMQDNDRNLNKKFGIDILL